uniref:Putative monolaris n=1 Tax=Rhipicephalus pulchellus TaxID=72859 RepID=L7LSQ7_RHIPC
MRILLFPFFAFYNVVFLVPAPAKGASSACYSMPSEDEECESDVSKWYYDKNEVKCVNFMYGECPTGSNIFDTEDQCKTACKDAGSGPKGPPPPPKPPKGRPPSKGRPQKKPKYPKKRPGEENETGSSGESTKGPGAGGWKPPRRPQRPHRPPGTRPKPPAKGKGRGSCAARMRRKKGCDFEGTWYNNGAFYTCSRVRKGGCPTVGSFFATCEECMGACYHLQRKIKQCAFMT